MNFSKHIEKYINAAFYFFLLFYTLIFTLITINRYFQYEVFYYDFGIFERAIYLMSQFKPPIIEHYVVGGKLIFADHLNPSLFFISLIYKLYPKQEFLLFLQVLSISLSGYIVYLIGRKISSNNLFSSAISAAYLLFIGTQNALISDFHAITVSNLFYALFVYFYLSKNWWAFLFSYLLFLGFKENLFIVGTLTLLGLYLNKPQWKKKIFLLSVFSLIYGFASIKLIISYFFGQDYFYTPSLPSKFKDYILRWFLPLQKTKTLLISLGTFLFLPLINYKFYLPLLANFFIRFIPENTQGRWGLGLHYSVDTAVILAVSSAFAYPILKSILSKKSLSYLPILILLITFAFLFSLKPPIILGFLPDFYKHSRNFTFLDKPIEKISQECSVMTQNNLLPHLNHNKEIFLLRQDYEKFLPDVILLDLREGQNPNNFWQLNYEATKELYKKLKSDPNYSLAYSTKDQFIFVKKSAKCIRFNLRG